MRWRYLLLAGSLLALGGCKNLETVQSLSTTLVSASKSLDSVSKEIEANCIRREQFNPAVQCEEAAKASTGLVAADKLLTDYFSALGQAAGAQSFTVKSGLDALATSVSAIPGINVAQVTAASGLADAIAILFTETDREKALRQMIGDGVPHAKVLVELLRTRVPAALDTNLQDESDSLTSQFVAYSGGAFGPKPEDRCVNGPKSADFPSGSNFLLAVEYCRHLKIIQSKRAAITNYQAALNNIDSTLDVLNSSKSDLSGGALAIQLLSDVNQLDINIEAVQLAFSSGGAV